MFIASVLTCTIELQYSISPQEPGGLMLMHLTSELNLCDVNNCNNC